MPPHDEPSVKQPVWGRALDAVLEPATAVVLAWIAAVGLVMHADPLLATLVVLGAVGAFLAGLVGVGGAIVMIPLLLYVPPALGTGRLSMHDVAAVTMVQVLAAASSGLAGHLRGGFVDRQLVVNLGSGMAVGSLVGAIGSRWLPAVVLQAVFATLAAAAALLMITMARRAADARPVASPPPRRVLGFVIALAVGMLAGAVGAGGAFLMIPIMLYVLHVPARIAVGSSLAVVFAAAVMGTLGKLVTAQIPGWPALALVAGALPAAQLGAAVSQRLGVVQLKLVLALLIAIVAVKMWWEILV